jgi:DNA/RNA-binding domain of Phe-tRNA-synthetase-like protein
MIWPEWKEISFSGLQRGMRFSGPWDLEKTKMTRESRDVILVTEGLPPVTIDEINGAVLDMKELVQNHCGGKVDAGILYNANREWEI